jgi:hypothetical protein
MELPVGAVVHYAKDPIARTTADMLRWVVHSPLEK